jgi:hypothetical protein
MVKQGQFILLNITEFSDWLKVLKMNRQIILIQQHHTWSPSYKQFNGSNQFQMVKGMKEYHLSVGFSDIAQNITIFPNGDIMICRPFDIAPAGIKGANSYGICIENVGNFDKGMDIMTETQKNSILVVTALLCKKFNLVPSTDSIVYHHWYDLNTGERTNGKYGSVKSCPSENFFDGNTVESANKNFIPLVKNKLNEINGVKNVGVSPTLQNDTSKFHKTCVVSVDKLNCRKSPINGDVIKQFSKGDNLTFVDYDSTKTWGKLITSDWIGWISLDCVSDIKDLIALSPSQIADAKAGIKFRKSVIVNCDKLNCRKSPIDGQILKQYKLNDKLTIVDYNTDNTWGKLSFGNNEFGWISLAYVKFV